MSTKNRLLANRYEIEKIAGRGGTSVVYKAYDLQAERAVRAIKEINKSNRDVYDMAKLESALIKELYESDQSNAFFPNIIHRFETENYFYIVHIWSSLLQLIQILLKSSIFLPLYHCQGLLV